MLQSEAFFLGKKQNVREMSVFFTPDLENIEATHLAGNQALDHI